MQLELVRVDVCSAKSHVKNEQPAAVPEDLACLTGSPVHTPFCGWWQWVRTEGCFSWETNSQQRIRLAFNKAAHRLAS